MRRIFTVLFLLVAFGFSFAQTTSDVTFKVNMGVAAAKGKFDPSKDSIYIAGTMNGWTANSTVLRRTSSTTDTVYTVTLNMIVDSTYAFKFIAPKDSWESVDNRTYKVKANAADNVFSVFFNNDNIYPSGTPKDIKLTFKCNMELEIAKGLFNPGTDMINVRGVSASDSWGASPLKMKKPTTGSMYYIDTTIAMVQNGTLSYKYAYTQTAKNATVWESGDNRSFTLTQAQYDAGSATVSTRYFDDGDLKASENAFDVYFTVNCKNAIPAGGSSFPNGIKSVVVCGSQSPLAWPGVGWPDTDAGLVIKANDDGTNGDLVKGDNIWTAKVSFPKYSGIKFEYKYGINYAMPSDNGGVNDNESSVGGNHILTLPKNATVIRTNDVFGTMGDVVFTGVKKDENVVVKEYSLEQNFPNPFNPSTVIRFSVPNNGMVTLKVYDVLGKEVATLINSELKAGQYEQQFNASNMTSGLYFYTIQSGSFVQTKKMMLIK